jgi:hypothetical protein
MPNLRHDDRLDLSNRLALSIGEAARAVGLSENAFRKALPDIERVYVGKRVLIPVLSLQKWLRESACHDGTRDETLLDELTKDLG